MQDWKQIENKLQYKPDGIGWKRTISQAEGNIQLYYVIQSTIHL
jgi:hypothetical protein